MKTTSQASRLVGLVAVCLLAAGEALGYGQALSAVQIVEKSHLAFFYPGDDMAAKVTMRLIDPGGGLRTRVLTMLRRDAKKGGNQKYYIYFHDPADVRKMAFLVWKYPEKNDDRWIFIPAVNLVRRIAAQDSRSSFAGSDFNHEDVSGRDVAADVHTLKGGRDLGGKRCFLIESTPRTPAEYRRKLAWVDQEMFLPLKEEYYDRRGELYKVFSADQVEKAGGFWTVIQRTMKDVKNGHRTEVVFEQVRYNVGLTDDLFTERYLRNPPRKWIQ